MNEANNNGSIESNVTSITEHNSTSEENIKDQESSDNKEKQNNIDWHKLAHKLREHNRKLLKKVFQLEQEIIESNQSLKEQQKLVRSNDLFAAKQAEQINQYQEEIAELLHKVESYQQETYSQQNVIATLTQQLESFQQKTIKLEQDCLDLQAANNAKTYELLDKNQKLQELNSRLHRQKQTFLQRTTNNNQDKITTNHNRDKINSEPIKAWSAQLTEKKASPTKTFIAESKTGETKEESEKAIANNYQPVSSIAAVQLPRFSRHAEGE